MPECLGPTDPFAYLNIDFAAPEVVERRVRRDRHGLPVEFVPDRDWVALSRGEHDVPDDGTASFELGHEAVSALLGDLIIEIV